MNGTKSIFLSLTFWGAIIAVLSAVAGIFGFSVDAADQATLSDLANGVAGNVAAHNWGGIIAGIGSAFGGLVAIYGRIVASKTVTVTGK